MSLSQMMQQLNDNNVQDQLSCHMIYVSILYALLVHLSPSSFCSPQPLPSSLSSPFSESEQQQTNMAGENPDHTAQVHPGSVTTGLRQIARFPLILLYANSPSSVSKTTILALSNFFKLPPNIFTCQALTQKLE